MTELGAVVQHLRQQRKRLIGELRQLDKAIGALGRVSLGSRNAKSSLGKRTMSAAARKRIAAAQKARWAKFRASTKRKVA